jgi:hypothetical protein
MDQSGIIGLVALGISIIGSVLGVINHRRLRSHCCGQDLVASIDLESTTPPESKEDLKIKIPKKAEDVKLPPSPEPPRINRVTYDA